MMKKINAILLMAGNGTRTKLLYNKALYEINKIPLFMYSLLKFKRIKEIDKIYLVVNECDYNQVLDILKSNNEDVILVKGGKTRSESVKHALMKIDNSHDIIIHDAARPLTNINDIVNLINTTNALGTLYHHAVDTVKEVSKKVTTLNRDELYMISTPQYFSNQLISYIINNENEYTDELQIFEKDYKINFIEETSLNIKVTTEFDLEYVTYILTSKLSLIGHSYDFHPFDENKKLILGGVRIDEHVGLKGHSDADALYHAVTEAIIGALSLGDIGTLFPDNDPKYKDKDSSYFLVEVMNEVKKRNLYIRSIDSIMYVEKPNLKKYKYQMAQNIKRLTDAEYVNVKATTMEKCGLVGEEKGIGCEAVCLVLPKNN